MFFQIMLKINIFFYFVIGLKFLHICNKGFKLLLRALEIHEPMKNNNKNCLNELIHFDTFQFSSKIIFLTHNLYINNQKITLNVSLNLIYIIQSLTIFLFVSSTERIFRLKIEISISETNSQFYSIISIQKITQFTYFPYFQTKKLKLIL